MSLRLKHFRRFLGFALILAMIMSLLSTYIEPLKAATRTSYDVLVNDYPGFINELRAAGATEAQIKAFLTDIEADATAKGINENNFDVIMLAALKDNVADHMDLAIIIGATFPNIVSDLRNEVFPSELVPIYNSVKAIVLGKPEPPKNTENSPKGGSDSNNQEIDEVDKQIRSGSTVIKLMTTGSSFTLLDTAINKINDAAKVLELKFGLAVITFPELAIPKIANGNYLTITVAGASQDQNFKVITEQRVISPFVDITIKDKDNKAVSLLKAANVSIFYNPDSLRGVNEKTLSVFAFNEMSKKWEIKESSSNVNNYSLLSSSQELGKFTVVAELAKQNPVNSSRFTDIIGHWAEQDIRQVSEWGWISGISASIFAPDRSIKRAEFAAILVRALEIPPAYGVVLKHQDVVKGSWYYDSLQRAVNIGLISGLSPSKMEPESNITREQMAVMLDRALKYKGINMSSQSTTNNLERFKDKDDIAVWAQPSVSIMSGLGIINGRTNGNFDPRDYATRAEAVAMLVRCNIK